MKLKQILQVLTAAALSVCCLTAGISAGATDYDYDCDINGDGAEDVLDVIALNRYLTGTYYVSDPSVMDVTGNLIVDTVDSQCIMAVVTKQTFSYTYIDDLEDLTEPTTEA